MEIKTYSCPGVSVGELQQKPSAGDHRNNSHVERRRRHFITVSAPRRHNDTARRLCVAVSWPQMTSPVSIHTLTCQVDDTSRLQHYSRLTSSSWSPAFVVFSTHNVPFLIARESTDDRRKLSMSVNACAEVCVVATWRVVVLKAVKADDRTEGSSRSVCSQPAGLALNAVVVNFILSSFYLFFSFFSITYSPA